MKKGGVYAIRNLVSSRIYVGSTSYFNKRWAEHRCRLNKNIHDNAHLQRSWSKHGKDRFIFEILEIIEDITLEKLIEREQYWMDLLKSNDREFGYNFRKIAASNYGIKLSAETKRKMSIAAIGRKHSDQSKKKMLGRVTRRNINRWPHLGGCFCKCKECYVRRACEKKLRRMIKNAK